MKLVWQVFGGCAGKKEIHMHINQSSSIIKRLVACLGILLVSVSLVFASAQSEQLHQNVTQALSAGDVATTIKAYEDLQNQMEKEYSNAVQDMAKAYEKRDRKGYDEAYATLNTLASYRLDKEQTDSLLKAILAEEEPQRTADAQWLYRNSKYYRPTLSLDYSTKGDGYSYSYSQQQTLMPGSEITLPDADALRFNTSRTGQLVGWGLTPDSVAYQAGETITMPFTSQTLYAQWQSAVTFSDPVSGMDVAMADVEDGANIAVPVPTAPDGSYIFMGWRERSTGKTLASDASNYTVVGKGAAFQAMWKSLMISDLYTEHYSVSALPVNTQLTVGFTLKSQGTEPLRNITVTLSSDSPNLTVLNPTITYRGLSADDSGVASGFRILIHNGVQGGTQLPLTVTATDSAGNSWSQTFTCTVK